MTEPKIDGPALRKACIAIATKHYADRFKKPVDDPHVLMNADANWDIFSSDLITGLEEYLKHAP